MLRKLADWEEGPRYTRKEKLRSRVSMALILAMWAITGVLTSDNEITATYYPIAELHNVDCNNVDPSIQMESVSATAADLDTRSDINRARRYIQGLTAVQIARIGCQEFIAYNQNQLAPDELADMQVVLRTALPYLRHSVDPTVEVSNFVAHFPNQPDRVKVVGSALIGYLEN